MISKKMHEALNTQINKEMYSAYLYLSMATYAASKGMSGVAQWFKVQYEEEMSHAMKFYAYLEDQGERVLLSAIEAPDTEFDSVPDLFSKALEHEKKVTGMINNLMKLAREDSDFASEIFLQWFVSEQVEEEASVNEIIDKFNLAGDEGRALMMIDKELAARTFTPPASE